MANNQTQEPMDSWIADLQEHLDKVEARVNTQGREQNQVMAALNQTLTLLRGELKTNSERIEARLGAIERDIAEDRDQNHAQFRKIQTTLGMVPREEEEASNSFRPRLGMRNNRPFHEDVLQETPTRATTMTTRGTFEEDRGLKLDLPEFDGSYDPEAFMDWMRTLDRIFEYKEFDEHRKFKLATLKLTKHASLWYDNMKARRRREGKEKLETWEALKRKMKQRFVPKEFEQQQFLKLTHLQQGSSTVQDYLQQFEHTTMLCDMDEREELKIARFIKGLNPMIGKKVELLPYVSFDDVVRLTYRIEAQEKASKFVPREVRNWSQNLM